jgi:hypothetical protein
MFNDEDFGDGYSNDLQRAHAYERLETIFRDERDKAEAFTRDGKTVVMVHTAVYGRVTDGYLGAEYLIRKVCDSEEEAHKWIAGDGIDDDDCQEFIYRLVPTPPKPAAPPPVQPEEDEELPF